MKKLIALPLSVLAFACGSAGDQESPALNFNNEIVSVAGLERDAQGPVVIDLRHSNSGYLIEAEVDRAAIEVVCPSGATMSLEGLMSSASADTPENVLMFSSLVKDPVTQKVPLCDEPPCHLHEEPGPSWVCFCP